MPRPLVRLHASNLTEGGNAPPPPPTPPNYFFSFPLSFPPLPEECFASRSITRTHSSFCASSCLFTRQTKEKKTYFDHLHETSTCFSRAIWLPVNARRVTFDSWVASFLKKYFLLSLLSLPSPHVLYFSIAKPNVFFFPSLRLSDKQGHIRIVHEIIIGW